MGYSILSRRDRIELENGMFLRLLSALELMQARRAASLLAEEEQERALCSNACLLARALEEEPGKPLFHSGQEVLAGLTVEEISALARRWSQFNREENPGLSLNEEDLENVKKTALRPRRASALAGTEAVRRSAHRGSGAADAGQRLPLVSGEYAARPGGGAGQAVSRLPDGGRGQKLSELRSAGDRQRGLGQPRL